MSEVPSRHVPINEASSNRVSFDVTLPGFISSQIGVDLRRIHQLCQIGDISTLRVMGVTDDKRVRPTPTTVGINSQGGAYAGFKAEQSEDPYFSVDGHTQETHISMANWTSGTIKLNIPEITEKIGYHRRWKGEMRSPTAWSSLIDHAIRNGINEIGFNHLVRNLRPYDIAETLFMHGCCMGLTILNGNPTIPRYLSSLALMTIVHLCINSHDYGVERLGRGTRLSLIHGPQFDRALILKLLSSRSGVVKSLKS